MIRYDRNNVRSQVFFEGALDTESTHINEDMKKAAVEAIANLIDEDELNPDYCIPGPFDKRVAPSVAREVAKAAMETGVARMKWILKKFMIKQCN